MALYGNRGIVEFGGILMNFFNMSLFELDEYGCICLEDLSSMDPTIKEQVSYTSNKYVEIRKIR